MLLCFVLAGQRLISLLVQYCVLVELAHAALSGVARCWLERILYELNDNGCVLLVLVAVVGCWWGEVASRTEANESQSRPGSNHTSLVLITNHLHQPHLCLCK